MKWKQKKGVELILHSRCQDRPGRENGDYLTRQRYGIPSPFSNQVFNKDRQRLLKTSPQKRIQEGPKVYLIVERFLVMDNEKKMQFVLTLSDFAEGLGTVIESLKLIANGLDDVANLLRDTVANGETVN